ncbi:MAG TPA: alpha-mannosidase 2c1, partial [Verrucomicrobia bacterium]|nr:alpha-mannosidase 2c1 [Verrucomicrobiota bacterium]
RQRLRFELAVGNSTLVQVVTLAADTKRLDIETTADWREKHRMLRVSFPVSVQTESFSSDIQYGCIQRPTHRNTSWDTARFEVAAHRYVDLSDRDYGVALLNDCKYGHKVHENVLDLNLLRSPTYPDPDADQGAHVFNYSLLPHTGTLIESPVLAEAACLNVPVLAFEGRRGAFTSPCRLEGRGVSLEVIKRAEKTNTVVIRLVETDGRNSTCHVLLADPKTVLVETNLVEWTEDGRFAPGPDGAVELTLSPYAIRTFKLQR